MYVIKNDSNAEGYSRNSYLNIILGWEGDGALIQAPETCSDEQLKRCADNAEPLYKDPELVVPDNPKAVTKVCR